jgi:hypothetical protein
MAWRAARSLLVLHQQLQAGAPRARPPATPVDAWGLIGDAEHDPESDHSPHDFPGWGNDIVTAGDFPNRPDLGLDAHKVLDDIRRSHDARVKYAISNGEMFSSYPARGYDAWTWRPYTGTSDKHYTHGHLSVVGEARADGEQPWATIGGDDMTPEQDERLRNVDTWLRQLVQVEDLVPLQHAGKTSNWPNKLGAAVKQLLAAAQEDKVRDAALAAAVQSLAVGAGIDPDALLARVEEAVTGAVRPLQEQLAAVQARNMRLAEALAAAGGALDTADD